MNIEIQNKSPREYEKNTKILSSMDVLELKEIDEIRNATQEHLIFLGLDRALNLRTLKLIGIGTSSGIFVSAKDVLRTALLTASDNVVLIHNHPSNILKASNEDKELTNKLNKFLGIFNINLIDHIIVTEEEHLSMMNLKQIDNNYSNDGIEFVEKALLLEENKKLKNEIEELKNVKENRDMNKYESIIILKPTLTEEELNKSINDYKEKFEKLSNKPVTVENMGKKKLAYEIQGNKEGHYAIFNFYAKSEDISDIDRNYRIDDNVMKFINVRQDMEAEDAPETMEDEDEMEME